MRIEELGRSVVFLTRENQELREQNEILRQMVVRATLGGCACVLGGARFRSVFGGNGASLGLIPLSRLHPAPAADAVAIPLRSVGTSSARFPDDALFRCSVKMFPSGDGVSFGRER